MRPLRSHVGHLFIFGNTLSSTQEVLCDFMEVTTNTLMILLQFQYVAFIFQKSHATAIRS